MLVANCMSTSLDSAFCEDVYFNAVSSLSASTLFIHLQLEKTEKIHTLINSGASESFIDSQFAISQGFPLSNLSCPLHLSLFNSSTASQGLIVQSTTLNAKFPNGTTHPIRFLLTPLTHSTSAVLGYSWLLQQNPSIDWATHEITFQTKVLSSPVAAPGATDSGAHSQLSECISLPAPLTDLSRPSLELQAAAVSITILFVCASALGLM